MFLEEGRRHNAGHGISVCGKIWAMEEKRGLILLRRESSAEEEKALCWVQKRDIGSFSQNAVYYN